MTMKTATRRSTRGATVATTGTAAPAPGRWLVDAAGSSLQISVKVGFIATVTGRFTDVGGHVDIADDVLDSRISVEVDTASLTSGNSHWDSVLIGAGLVDIAANPTIAFSSTGITPRGAGWILAGILVTERGCLPVQFDLECTGCDSAVDADRVRFRARGSITSKDAVRLLSQPGVDRLIGKSMTVDLMIATVRAD